MFYFSDRSTFDDEYIKFVFRGRPPRQNLFTLEAMQEVCQYEEQVVMSYPHNNGMKVTNCRALSLGYMVGLLAGNKDCMNLTQEDVTMVLDLIEDCMPLVKYAQQDVNETRCNVKLFNQNAIYLIRTYLVDLAFSQDFVATYTILAYPVTYFDSLQFYRERIEDKTFQGNHIELVALGLDRLEELYNLYLAEDVVLLIIGAAFILCLTLMYTKSFMLTIAMILGICFSFIMAYFIYCVILKFEFFPFLNLLSLLVLIAIGADDVFVFNDIWSQEKLKYVANYPNEKLTRKDLYVILSNTLNHAALSIFLTSLSTASAFLINIMSIVSVIKCFGLFSGLCILGCFFFMLSWIPAIVILLELHTSDSGKSLCGSWKCVDKLERCLKKVTSIVFEILLPYLIGKLWWLWIVLLLLLGGGSLYTIFGKPGLQAPTSQHLKHFSKHNLILEYDFYIGQKFKFFGLDEYQAIRLSYVFGVVAIDNGNYYNPDDKGHLVLDNKFKFSDPEMINFLTNFCEDLLHVPFISDSRKPSSICLLSFIKESVNDACGDNNPIKAPCCGLTWPLAADVFEQCMPEVVLKKFGSLDSGSDLLGIPYIDSNFTIRAFTLNVKSNHAFSVMYEPMKEFYSTTRKFLETRLEKNPKIPQSAYINYYKYMLLFDLQQGLYKGTFFTVAMSLTCALAVLFLSTFNLLISVYAIFSISLGVSLTVGILVLLGWELNILQSVIITVAIGLSIDFTIHYGTAYIISKETSRSHRVKSSFRTVGPAVVMAALTSFLAGTPEVVSKISSFRNLGIFLMLVMACSWLYATFLFQSLCHCIGPNTKQLQLLKKCFPASIVKKLKVSHNIKSLTLPSPSTGQYISTVGKHDR